MKYNHGLFYTPHEVKKWRYRLLNGHRAYETADDTDAKKEARHETGLDYSLDQVSAYCMMSEMLYRAKPSDWFYTYKNELRGYSTSAGFSQTVGGPKTEELMVKRVMAYFNPNILSPSATPRYANGYLINGVRTGWQSKGFSYLSFVNHAFNNAELKKTYMRDGANFLGSSVNNTAAGFNGDRGYWGWAPGLSLMFGDLEEPTNPLPYRPAPELRVMAKVASSVL